MASSRQDRLRRALEADLAKLPDLLLAEPEPEATMAASVQDGLTSKHSVNVKQEHWGAIDEDSSDSEDGCVIEMVPITDPEDNENNVSVCDDDCSDDEAELLAKSGPSNGLGSLVRDTLSPIGTSFVPIVPLSKFPYKYIPKERKEDVADAFFNAGQFWDRSWDLYVPLESLFSCCSLTDLSSYYVWPESWTEKPLVLVTFDQFANLLKEIRRKFKGLRGTDPTEHYYIAIGLVIPRFPDPSRFRPRFLGTSSSKIMFEKMVIRAPGPRVSLIASEHNTSSPFHDNNEVREEENREEDDAEAELVRQELAKEQILQVKKKSAESRAVFKEIFDKIKASKKGKGKSYDTVEPVDQRLSLESGEEQLLKAQRYLGLLLASIKAGK
jgi:hypothetical protein